MDYNFIERAEKITAFNITIQDLQTVDYKKEIRYLFGKHFFPSVELTGIAEVDKEKINGVVTELKTCSLDNFRQLHNYNMKGVGPGELTLFCIVNSACLGGGSSAGLDIRTDCGEYEVKAVSVNNERLATNFKLGGTVSLHDLIIDLDNLREELKLPGTRSEIPKSTITTMRKHEQFTHIEAKFKVLTCDYFNSHKTIFMNHNSSKAKIGFVESIKYVKPEDVMIERVTGGTIKPAVKL